MTTIMFWIEAGFGFCIGFLLAPFALVLVVALLLATGAILRVLGRSLRGR